MADHYMAGLRPVVLDIMLAAGYDLVELGMPDDQFWPFGHYFMMPRALIQEYALFVDKAMAIFAQRHSDLCRVPGEKGDFHRLQQDLLAGGPCFAKLADFLLHAWSRATGVELIFVVDELGPRYNAACPNVAKEHCRRQLLPTTHEEGELTNVGDTPKP